MKHAALLRSTVSGVLMLGTTLVVNHALARAGAGPTAARNAPSAASRSSAAPEAAPAPQAPAPAPRDASASASSTPPVAAPTSATCAESLPEGKSRPNLVERFPSRGLAGHAAWLEVDVEHERAEHVMPGGLALALQSAESSHLERAGFALPDPAGGAKPRLARGLKGDKNLTKLAIPVVPLPHSPGRHELELPPLPITIARASGDVITLCTKAHTLVVDEPIANEPNPKPKHNPPPERQLEIWESAKQVTSIALATLALAALLAFILFKLGLLRHLKRMLWRDKPVPPPRPPWETALEELFDIRNAGLVHAGRYAEHYDRVSDTVRKYLGERYDFDGLESTTREVLQRLRRVAPTLPVLAAVEKFLRDADLVKFARLTPTEHQCEQALTEAEHIVTSTRPEPTNPAETPGGPEESPRGVDADAPSIDDPSGGPAGRANPLAPGIPSRAAAARPEEEER